jgi:hypothetical protein
MKKEVGSGVGSGSGFISQRYGDLRIRIRNKMSQIPSTDLKISFFLGQKMMKNIYFSPALVPRS